MQLGIIADHLGTSQLSYLLNLQVNQPGPHDFVLFQRQPAPPISRFYTSVFPINEIYNSKCNLIATDLDSARYLTKLPRSTRKVFYPWNLEWKKHGNNYLETISILQDPRIEVIARSPDHASYINLFREVDGIIEDFNLAGFIEYLLIPRKQVYTNRIDLIHEKV